MGLSLARALEPLTARLPIRWPRRFGFAQRHYVATPQPGQNTLVAEETHLKSVSQVERRLPDILGRALARVWIDAEFRDAFADDPKGFMAAHGVHLPDAIEVEFRTAGLRRPQIVVFETLADHTRRRLLYLQLVMVAGK